MLRQVYSIQRYRQSAKWIAAFMLNYPGIAARQGHSGYSCLQMFLRICNKVIANPSSMTGNIMLANHFLGLMPLFERILFSL